MAKLLALALVAILLIIGSSDTEAVGLRCPYIEQYQCFVQDPQHCKLTGTDCPVGSPCCISTPCGGRDCIAGG